MLTAVGAGEPDEPAPYFRDICPIAWATAGAADANATFTWTDPSAGQPWLRPVRDDRIPLSSITITPSVGTFTFNPQERA